MWLVPILSPPRKIIAEFRVDSIPIINITFVIVEYSIDIPDMFFKFLCFSVLSVLPAFIHGQCQVEIGVDTVLGCIGDTAFFSATNGQNYDWSGGPLSCAQCQDPYHVFDGNAYTMTVQSSGTVTLPAVNGDFSQGNTGFSTAYTYNATSIWNEGTYSIGPNPNAVHPNFGTWGDHTTGSGNYMLVNGSTSGSVVLWQQTVSFPPGVQVTMELWMLTFVTPPGSILISVNGANLGAPLSTPNTAGLWQLSTRNFTVPPSGVCTIAITTTSSAVAGNDFGIDDISFSYTCTSTDEVYVASDEVSRISAFSDVSQGCDTLCTTFTNTSSLTSEEASYRWDYGDGGPLHESFDGSHCYNSPGTYYVQLSARTARGCTSSAYVDTIVVGQTMRIKEASILSPEGRWVGDTYVMPSDDPNIQLHLVFDDIGDMDDIEIEWGDGTIDHYGPYSNIEDHTANHIYSSFNRATICITTVGTYGCTYHRCIEIAFTPSSEIPDAFSPNGDGVNDYFRPRFFAVDEVKWTVYDRWGKEVFSAESTDAYWDGTVRGNRVPEGVYFMVARAKGQFGSEPMELKSTVHVFW